MAKRRFELPGIQDLSKEQEAVRALPREGQHLIVGGPGTGKTVVALIRARRYQRDQDDYVFLVFNHLLHRASAQLFPGELSGATWWAWFRDQFETIAGETLPRKSAERGDFRQIDWDGVRKVVSRRPVSSRPPITNAPFLIIDEGQDMPPQFYRVLVALGFESFFVAADQNQQIHDEHNSSRRDIETELAIDTEDVVELKHNYRNCGPVAKLARAFYTGDPASPQVDLPSRHGPAALLCDYTERRFAGICRRILKLVDRDPATLIGVIAPNNEVRERYLVEMRNARHELLKATQGLDNGAPRIETFFGQHRPDVRFDEGGILVTQCPRLQGSGVRHSRARRHRQALRPADRPGRREETVLRDGGASPRAGDPAQAAGRTQSNRRDLAGRSCRFRAEGPSVEEQDDHSETTWPVGRRSARAKPARRTRQRKRHPKT